MRYQVMAVAVALVLPACMLARSEARDRSARCFETMKRRRIAPRRVLKRTLQRIAVGVAVLALAAGFSSRAEVLLQDDFNDGDATGWREIDGTFSVVDGIYAVSSNGFCNDARAINGNPAWTDYAVDVDFNFPPGGDSHAALLFRAEDVQSAKGAQGLFAPGPRGRVRTLVRENDEYCHQASFERCSDGRIRLVPS